MAILIDRRGWLWLGTDNGVLAWNGQSWRQLTQESGLIWNDVNSSRLASGADGSIWIGTSGGLGHFMHPEHVFDSVLLPISMMREQWGAKTFPPGLELNLPWSEEELSFEVASPLTLNRSNLKFSYRIAELEPQWTETQDTTLQFQALSPGRYTLEVKASNAARNAQSAVIRAQFRIAPPWWRAPWFYVLCTILSIWILALFYYLRTRHLMALKRRLEDLVLERTIELVKSREAMRIQATRDSLTGLQNRGAILGELDQEIERCQREQTPMTLVLADIDFFKQINDTYGHLAGDEALRQFANALRDGIRTYDHVGRYGGEEFLVVMPGIAAEDLEDRLARLHQSVSNLTVCSGNVEFRMTCSVGAVFLDPAQGPIQADQSLAAADRALYIAKQTGRNRFVHHSFAGRGHLA